MRKPVKPGIWILFLGVVFFASGCEITLAEEFNAGIERLEAEVIAERIALEKSKETKPSTETKPLPEVKVPNIGVRPEKIDDLAWESIRKQKIDAAKPLALTELIDIAMRNNPKTRQAWEDTRVAQAVEKQAESKLYPQANISAEVIREKNIPLVRSGSSDDLQYGPSFKLNYLLLDFGGRAAGIEETSQKLASANFQYNQALQDLLLNVETSYYNLYSAQSNLEAARIDADNSKIDFEAAQQRLDAGLVTRLDVLQAKSNYDDSLYELEDAKGQLKTARANLAQAIGLAADTKFEIVIPDKSVPTDVNETDVSLLIEESIRRRPDIASQRADLKAKQAAIKAANSDLWPTVNLGGAVGRNQHKYYGFDNSKNFDYNYSGSLGISWDIFDGFYNLNKKRQAENEAGAEYEKLLQVELELSADVWIKYYDFNTAVQKLTYGEAFFNTANTSYELARESYEAGLKSILDLLQSQAKLSEARSRLIKSKQDVFVALVELAHATGAISYNGR